MWGESGKEAVDARDECAAIVVGDVTGQGGKSLAGDVEAFIEGSVKRKLD